LLATLGPTQPSGVDPYAGQSLSQWLNPAAFAVPPNNVGRFGTSSVGNVVAPEPGRFSQTNRPGYAAELYSSQALPDLSLSSRDQ
jgi:hypothetical protein